MLKRRTELTGQLAQEGWLVVVVVAEFEELHEGGLSDVVALALEGGLHGRHVP